MHDIERLTLALVAAAAVAEPQNLLEHLPCNGDLGHLEDNIATVAHHLRADLDQLVLQCRQRPVLGSGVASVRRKLPRSQDAGLDKYSLGKQSSPVEGELPAMMTQQCRVRYRLRRPIWSLGPHQLYLIKARSSLRAADGDAARPQLWWKSTRPIAGSA